MFLLENEYHQAIREAELAWVRGLVRELREGSFPLMKEWDHWTRTGELPAGLPAELYQAVGLAGPAAAAVAGTGAEEAGAEAAGPDGASAGKGPPT